MNERENWRACSLILRTLNWDCGIRRLFYIVACNKHNSNCCALCSDHRDAAEHSEPAWSRECRQLEMVSINVVQDWRRWQGTVVRHSSSYRWRRRGGARWDDKCKFFYLLTYSCIFVLTTSNCMLLSELYCKQ